MTDTKRYLLLWFLFFFLHKKTSCSDVATLAGKSAIKSTPQNEQLAEELYKSIIRKFKKRKVHSPFINHVFFFGCSIVKQMQQRN